MRKFHHVGIPTQDRQGGETYVPETKVSVTDPLQHPQRVEFLRYEPDSPVTGPLRDLPHIAFETDDLSSEIGGENVILGPFSPMPGLRVVFITKDGAVFEFIERRAAPGTTRWGTGTA